MIIRNPSRICKFLQQEMQNRYNPQGFSALHLQHYPFLFSGAQVFHGFAFQRDMAVEAHASFAGGALGFDAHLHGLFHRQVEQAHHVKLFAIQGVMRAEHVPHTDDLQPHFLLVDVAAVGVVADAVGHNAHRRRGSKVGLFKSGLGPQFIILDHHQGTGIVHALEVGPHLGPENEIAGDLGIEKGSVGHRGADGAVYRHGIVEPIGVPRGVDHHFVAFFDDLAFIQPFPAGHIHGRILLTGMRD